MDGRRRRAAHSADGDGRPRDHRHPPEQIWRYELSAPGWEHFDVEADVGVRAWGPTRAEAFAQVALGVMALIVLPDEVEARETREVRAQAESPEALLVAWVNECLYVHEIEGFVVHRVAVLSCTNALVVGALHGEPIDTRRHRPGTVVKGATMHEACVEARPGRYEISLIVDV